jgi:hypothetical protein
MALLVDERAPIESYSFARVARVDRALDAGFIDIHCALDTLM